METCTCSPDRSKVKLCSPFLLRLRVWSELQIRTQGLAHTHRHMHTHTQALLEMMGVLIERPLVHRDFQAKYPLLLSMYSQELDQSKAIFNQQVALNRSQQVTHTHTHFLKSAILIIAGTIY